jgi:regulator of nucleoside diphosphate kinase
MLRHESGLPPITLSEPDYELLTNLQRLAERTVPQVADYLSEELVRAHIVSEEALPDTVVTMGRKVTFRDEVAGETRTVTLVFPGEEDLEAGKLSVLTPMGAALIGLSQGQSIASFTRGGKERMLTVIEVRPA